MVIRHTKDETADYQSLLTNYQRSIHDNTIQDLSLPLGGAGSFHVRQYHHSNLVDFLCSHHRSRRQVLWSGRLANWSAVHVVHDRIHPAIHSRFMGH
jgi:hypothetical protein